MALIECGECGKQVSGLASACPGCGAPVDRGASVHVKVTRTGAKWEGMGFALVALGLVVMIAGSAWGAPILFAGLVIFIIGRFK